MYTLLSTSLLLLSTYLKGCYSSVSNKFPFKNYPRFTEFIFRKNISYTPFHLLFKNKNVSPMSLEHEESVQEKKISYLNSLFLLLPQLLYFCSVFLLTRHEQPSGLGRQIVKKINNKEPSLSSSNTLWNLGYFTTNKVL